MSKNSSEAVSYERIGRAGVIWLDRPGALNALTPPMIMLIARSLAMANEDAGIDRVAIRSTSPKAFCAGGDVRAIRELCLEGRFDEAMEFFRAEFALNLALGSNAKPVFSLVKGICMGGGMGLSMHGDICVATQDSLFAMPEAAIGYVTDVGSTYFLSRLPTGMGAWLGLTGRRFDGHEAASLGLVDHVIRPEQVDDAFSILCATAHEQVDRALLDLGPTHRNGPDPEWISFAERAFGGRSIADILDALRREPSLLRDEAMVQLSAGSPHSHALILELLDAGRNASLRQCLDNELNAARTAITHPDFSEGVRAMLVDKDRAPLWRSAG
ncbi:MAG: enoyl-CoA hydratase/isomerase family protein [Mesorhizobium sp.]|nr:MAG: enoyl-CoA hydratase/isomerase family protein [Mesorhizobium sp.]